MSAVDDAFAVGDLLFTVDENGAFALQLLDDKAVVHDLFAHVDGRAESLKGYAHHINGTNHARAEAPRLQ